MDWTDDAREVQHGTILVASGDALFADLVGDMVARCGFTPAYPATMEEAWLTQRRTFARLVICDCAAPAHGIRRLIIEASARRLPLVLSDPRVDQHGAARARSLLHHVAWLTFPITRESFARMLDELLATPADATHRVHANPVAIADEVARIIRTGPSGASELTLAEHSPSGIADERGPRSVIAAALAATPVHEQALRRGVWIYVGAERGAGASPGQVIVALTQLVEEANIVPMSVRQALMQSVMLWCVEAYFGQLGDRRAGHTNVVTSDVSDVVPSR